MGGTQEKEAHPACYKPPPKCSLQIKAKEDVVGGNSVMARKQEMAQ